MLLSKPPFAEEAPRKKSFRETVRFYMIDFETPLGKAIDVFIIILNLLVVAIFVINTYPISFAAREFLWKIELMAVAFFIIEYALRYYGAYDRWGYVKDVYSIIDLAAIAPTLMVVGLPVSGTLVDLRFIQLIRIFAVFRIFRFLRFFAVGHRLFGMITLGLLRVVRLIVTIIIIFFISSGFFYFVESPVNPEVQNFGDAFYFTVVALSTVGFGDIVPVSSWGRLVTVMMIISGIILIPLQASKIIKEWINVCARKTVICPGCGLGTHDLDAAYCKRCGHVLYKDEEKLEMI